jgi:general secretion pathway protein G
VPISVIIPDIVANSLKMECNVQINQFVSRKQSGFTLIEVMVVVVILGILAAIVVPRVMDRPDAARITKAKQDIRALESALNLYKLDNFVYPNTDQGLEALVSKPSSTPEPRNWKQYMDRLPKDPWGNDYQYLSPGVQGAVDIFSLGADGQPGGDEVNADIGNWNLQ